MDNTSSLLPTHTRNGARTFRKNIGGNALLVTSTLVRGPRTSSIEPLYTNTTDVQFKKAIHILTYLVAS